MISNSFKLLPKTFKYFRPYTCTASLNKGFCEWKPNVPKHAVKYNADSHHMAHPIWDPKDVENIQQTHRAPKTIRDHLALTAIKVLRRSFDIFTRYKSGHMDEQMYMRRFLFLEIIAGVPGMIGGIARHMRSVALRQHDRGWIHHLLEEAENERMHLFTYLEVSKPGKLFRLAVIGAQAAFIVAYSFLYILSSRMAHRFVGYLEEEAIKTYTGCLKELDEGKLPAWENLPAPKMAIKYWYLDQSATFRDVIVVIRADEVMHREQNHRFADLKWNAPAQNYTLMTDEEKNHAKL